jgi:hypothetical protein
MSKMPASCTCITPTQQELPIIVEFLYYRITVISDKNVSLSSSCALSFYFHIVFHFTIFAPSLLNQKRAARNSLQPLVRIATNEAVPAAGRQKDDETIDPRERPREAIGNPPFSMLFECSTTPHTPIY